MVLEIIHPKSNKSPNWNISQSIISTGFVELDDAIEGFIRSNLILITGGYDAGKTALITQLAYNLSQTQANTSVNSSTIYLSLQHNNDITVLKIMGANFDIPPSDFSERNAENRQQEKIDEALIPFNSEQIFHTAAELKSLSELIECIETNIQRSNTPVVLIDGLELIPFNNQADEKRMMRDALKTLKNLALRFNICVVTTYSSAFIEIPDDLDGLVADTVLEITKDRPYGAVPKKKNDEVDKFPHHEPIRAILENQAAIAADESDQSNGKRFLRVQKNNLNGKTPKLILKINKKTGKIQIKPTFPQELTKR